MIGLTGYTHRCRGGKVHDRLSLAFRMALAGERRKGPWMAFTPAFYLKLRSDGTLSQSYDTRDVLLQGHSKRSGRSVCSHQSTSLASAIGSSLPIMQEGGVLTDQPT